jgi:hypothetical protein
VLTTTGERSTSDSSERYTRQLFLDPTSGLPVAMSETGRLDDGSTTPTATEARYQTQFVDPSTLPRHLRSSIARLEPARRGRLFISHVEATTGTNDQ